MVCDKCSGSGQIKPKSPYRAAAEEVRDTMKNVVGKTSAKIKLGVLNMLLKKIRNGFKSVGVFLFEALVASWFWIVLGVVLVLVSRWMVIDQYNSRVVQVQYSDQGQVVRCWIDNAPDLRDHYAIELVDNESKVKQALTKMGAPQDMKCIRGSK